MTHRPAERKEIGRPAGAHVNFSGWWQVLQRFWWMRTCLLHLGHRRYRLRFTFLTCGRSPMAGPPLVGVGGRPAPGGRLEAGAIPCIDTSAGTGNVSWRGD